jgi:hypothetical protein
MRQYKRSSIMLGAMAAALVIFLAIGAHLIATLIA